MRALNDVSLDIDEEVFVQTQQILAGQLKLLGKAGKIKASRGSPGLVGDVEQGKKVACLSALGLDDEQIGAILGIEPKMLRMVFAPILQQASLIANAQVAKVALTQALAGDKDMVKFWLRSRAGWRETTVVEHTGKVEHEVSDSRRKLMEGLDIVDVTPVADRPSDSAAQPEATDPVPPPVPDDFGTRGPLV